VALQRVARSLPGDRWLSAANRYNQDCQPRLNEDILAKCVHPGDLAEYIGISGPVHCIDGWSCLGKAIHCFLRGDPYNAVHLAYYAELRAAFSLLASEGIGIFNRNHFIVNDAGETQPLGDQIETHQMTWLTFRWWAQQSRAIDLFKAVIMPDGQELSNWIKGFSSGDSSLLTAGTRWLNQWGMDLRDFFLDRIARNTASYWPTGIDPWNLHHGSEALAKLGEIWHPLEPLLSSRFEYVDRHFLRTILEIEYKAITNKSARTVKGRAGFAQYVRLMLTHMGVVDEDGWRKFLTRATEPEQLKIITAAGRASQIGSADHAIELVSRAILLLRIATGACSLHIAATHLSRSELNFWLESIGTDRGIWPQGQQPTEFIDLWEDINSALEEIPETNGESTPPGLERYDYLEKYSASISKLEEHERVAIWGLGF